MERPKSSKNRVEDVEETDAGASIHREATSNVQNDILEQLLSNFTMLQQILQFW